MSTPLILQVHHKSVYRYSIDVLRSVNVLYLRPRATARQIVFDAKIWVTPVPQTLRALTDRFGNCTDEIEITERHRVLEVLSEARVSVGTLVAPEPKFSLTFEEARKMVERPSADIADDVVPFLFNARYTAPTRAIETYAKESFPAGRPVLQGAIELMHRIHRDFRYDPHATDAMTPVERAFEMRAGVCQDLAHAGIACLRAMGLGARYVSGYLLTHPPPGEPKLIGADQSHAWFAVYAPPFGWIDLDPTNDVMPGERHVTLAWGRDYGDVAPISGRVVGGGAQRLDVSVDVAII